MVKKKFWELADKMMQNYRTCGVIFDADGTLLDSMDVWLKIDEIFLKKRGLDVPPDYQKIIAPMKTWTVAEYTIERFSLEEKPEDLIREWLDMADEAYRLHVPAKDGALCFVQKLHELGWKMAVATASEPELILPAMERTGILPYLETVVSGKEVERGKGFPDIYLEAAGRLGLRAEACIVFEDLLTCVRGAAMGGFHTVAVADSQNPEEQEALKKEADIYLDGFFRLV